MLQAEKENIEIKKSNSEYFSIANVFFVIISLLAIFSGSNVFLILLLGYSLIVFYQNLFNVKSEDIMLHLSILSIVCFILLSIPFLLIIRMIIIYIGVIIKNN